MFSLKEGKDALLRTIGNSDYAQYFVVMNYYVFRALEKVNNFKKTDELWDIRRDMVKNNLTTCVENSKDEHSDCHGWRSLILYELAITPNPGYLTYAKGQVVTPKGIIEVK